MLQLAALLPLLQELAKTDLGKNVLHQGKIMVMEVAMTILTKKASQISINFLPTNVAGGLCTESKSIQLTRPLDIVENGLSLPLSFHENQFKPINQKITEDLDVIKGQNEILFLSNSINYFLESHKTRTGINRGISHALQYDITAVCNYLGKHKEIRFPGYLLHQFTSLAATLKDLNIFYASILDEGNVPTFDEKEIREELLKGFGIDKRKGNFGMYVPFELKRRILRECMPATEDKKKGGSLIDSIKGLVTTREEVNDIAHDALFILEEELVANEELEHQIVKKLKMLPDKKIIVQS